MILHPKECLALWKSYNHTNISAPLNQKLVLATLVIRVDKGNANDINKKYIDLLKRAKVDCIFNDNT